MRTSGRDLKTNEIAAKFIIRVYNEIKFIATTILYLSSITIKMK